MRTLLLLALAAPPVALGAPDAPDDASVVEAPAEGAPLRLMPLPDPCDAWTRAWDPSLGHCVRLGKGWTFEAHGHLREVLTLPPDAQVDARGTTIGQGAVLDNRLRLGAGFGYESFKVETEWDLFTAQIAGDTWDIPGMEDQRRRDRLDPLSREAFVPRRASFSAVFQDKAGSRVPLMLVEAGLMPATWWGLGILANGGERDTRFGRVDGGDRMVRARATLAPVRSGGERLPLFFTVGGDAVIEDDTSVWREGQRTWHGLFSTVWRGPEGLTGGLFYTYRHQTEPGALPRPTSVHVIDAHVAADLDLSGWRLSLATEDALVVGTTQRALAYAAPDRTDVLSGALVGRIEAEDPKGLVIPRLDLGWTSASGDPDDGSLHDFTLDRNVNVGVVLFDELMGGVEAATYALLDDPTLSGGPPDGADALVTEGSVRRAAWIWPTVAVDPLDWLRLKAGYLAAWSTGPIAQPFYTFRAGGRPTNHLDQATDGRFLGHEVQWGVDLGDGPATADWPVRPKLFVEGGVGLPSDDLGGGTLVLVRGTARIDF